MDYKRSKLCYRYTLNCSYALGEHMDYVYREKILTTGKKIKK